MDGVCANFEHGIARLDPELFVGEGPDWEKRSQRVNEICWANPRIFRDLTPIEGADSAVRELKDLYEIYFLSTPMWTVPESFMDKRIWLHNHYGKWAEKRLILTHRKDLNYGEFLVDDTTRNGVDQFTGEHIHIFSDPRFPDWRSVTQYLKAKALV